MPKQCKRDKKESNKCKDKCKDDCVSDLDCSWTKRKGCNLNTTKKRLETLIKKQEKHIEKLSDTLNLIDDDYKDCVEDCRRKASLKNCKIKEDISYAERQLVKLQKKLAKLDNASSERAVLNAIQEATAAATEAEDVKDNKSAVYDDNIMDFLFKKSRKHSKKSRKHSKKVSRKHSKKSRKHSKKSRKHSKKSRKHSKKSRKHSKKKSRK